MKEHSWDQQLRAAASDRGATLLRYLVDVLAGPLRDRCTLLAVCPNSASVARGGLMAAQEAGAPAIFAATLNQVDRDGGYTGFTPQAFTAFLRAEAARLRVTVPVIPCLDHGGPWLKDAHVAQSLGLDDAMRELKRSIEACINAGYELLHLDPTVDRTVPDGQLISVDAVVSRTIELIDHAEAHCLATGVPSISYEVGTEEVHGGLADMARFCSVLERLRDGLSFRGLDHSWPVFVVGKVGTDLRTTEFDPDVARRLTSVARPFGSLVKGHYTDFVENPEDYPLSGIGGANVGPEFSQIEYEALRELCAFERKIGKSSGFAEAIDHAVEASGRWRKWLARDQREASFRDLDPEQRAWLLRTGSRYVWTAPDVQEARARLYENVSDYRDAEGFVLWRIKTSILGYHRAFNMIGFCERALSAAR